MSDKHLLDNIMWNSLSGPHIHFSMGGSTARRYAVGFSPIVGFADPTQPDFDALLPHCGPEEQFYCDGWTGRTPTNWRIEVESTMYKMVWNATPPGSEDAMDAIPLDYRHAQQAVDLAILTRPGPFGIRTIELGEYFGYFDGDKLIAMAGERTCAGTMREISGVCTHPDYQGRGLAHRLMRKLIFRQAQRGETSFLHVMRDNQIAHQLYVRMGFIDYKESVVRVIARR